MGICRSKKYRTLVSWTKKLCKMLIGRRYFFGKIIPYGGKVGIKYIIINVDRLLYNFNIEFDFRYNSFIVCHIHCMFEDFPSVV